MTHLSFFLCRLAGMPMAAAIPSLISWTFLLACLPAGRIAFFNIEYLFSFAVMPDGGQHSHTFLILSGAVMPACRL